MTTFCSPLLWVLPVPTTMLPSTPPGLSQLPSLSARAGFYGIEIVPERPAQMPPQPPLCPLSSAQHCWCTSAFPVWEWFLQPPHSLLSTSLHHWTLGNGVGKSPQDNVMAHCYSGFFSHLTGSLELKISSLLPPGPKQKQALLHIISCILASWAVHSPRHV